ANNIGASPHWGINTTYYDTTGNHVLNSVAYGGLWYDKYYSQGKALDEGKVRKIVQSTIDGNQLPSNTNAIDMVLAAQDVSESNSWGMLCGTTKGDYCGYHDHSVGGTDLKFAFIGNSSRCAAQCMASANWFVSPNSNLPADGMITVMTHELEETITDPDLN